MLQPADGEDFARLRTGGVIVPALISLKGLKMPSTADELAALRRSRTARCSGSRNHGLLSNNEPFIDFPRSSMTTHVLLSLNA